MDASHLDAEARRDRSGPTRAVDIIAPKGKYLFPRLNREGPIMKASKTIVGVDAAKRVFALRR